MRNWLYTLADRWLPFTGDLSEGQIVAGFGVVCLVLTAIIAVLIWDLRQSAKRQRLLEDIAAEKRLAEFADREDRQRRGLDAIMQAGSRSYRVGGGQDAA